MLNSESYLCVIYMYFCSCAFVLSCYMLFVLMATELSCYLALCGIVLVFN